MVASLFLNHRDRVHVGTDYVLLVRTELGNDALYQLIYFDISYYLFSFVLPLVLLAGFNSRLIITYRGVS